MGRKLNYKINLFLFRENKNGGSAPTPLGVNSYGIDYIRFNIETLSTRQPIKTHRVSRDTKRVRKSSVSATFWLSLLPTIGERFRERFEASS